MDNNETKKELTMAVAIVRASVIIAVGLIVSAYLFNRPLTTSDCIAGAKTEYGVKACIQLF